MALHWNSPQIEKGIKTTKFCLKILLVFLLTSCSKGDTKPEDEVFPIELM